MNASRTVYLETLGCQMNVLDSELVFGEMLARGYRPTEDFRQADVVVLNTCSVRQHAEEKVWSRLGQLGRVRRARPEQIVAVIGCMAERDGAALLQRAPQVDVLCGPAELHRLPALVDDVLQARGNGSGGKPQGRGIALSGHLRGHSTAVQHVARHDDLESLDSSRELRFEGTASANPYQAYVRITRGCNKFCTFCVVPMTRGLEQHRPAEKIVAEVRRLSAAGVREATLLGQTVNHYRHEDECGRVTTFAELLRRVHDEVPELPRLRFVTSFPRDFGDDALRAMAQCPRICRYLHLPAQCGSDRLLRAMNRGYTAEQYKSLLDRARALMPDLCLSGDMIVGFPGETEEDFAASVELLRFARYKNCFIFKYSPRPGTAAYERLADDVPDEVKRRRNNELLAVQAEINMANHRGLIGTRVEVLVSGPSKAALRRPKAERSKPGAGPSSLQLVGRTSGDQIVVFDGAPSLVGRIIPVEIVAVTPYTLHGRAEVPGAGDAMPPARAVTGLSLSVISAG